MSHISEFIMNILEHVLVLCVFIIVCVCVCVTACVCWCCVHRFLLTLSEVKVKQRALNSSCESAPISSSDKPLLFCENDNIVDFR